MSRFRSADLVLRLLENSPIILLALVFVVFSVLDHRFFDPQTLVNIGRQASYVGILAVGMTFVLLTAGIDLSVGAIAYLAAVIVSQLLRGTAIPVVGIVLLMVGIGVLCGLLSGAVMRWLRIIPFVVTLAAMGIYRGVALDASQSREADFPPAMSALGNVSVLGIPLPIMLFAAVVFVAHIVLTRTTYGRQLYAVGQDREAAERAGIPTRKILWSVYLISGGLAGLAAFDAVIQLGTVVPSFGSNDEFDAIAAAVLGGASLFGGRGSVFPGTVAGTLLVQMISVGLVFMQVDLYLTPMVSAAVIMLAVLLDTIRTRMLDRIARRSIRMERTDAAGASDPREAVQPAR